MREISFTVYDGVDSLCFTGHCGGCPHFPAVTGHSLYYLESSNQPRNLVDKAEGRVSTGKKQLAGIIVADKKWKPFKEAMCLLPHCLGPPASEFFSAPRCYSYTQK